MKEHNPIVNVKRMFDHLTNKKLERYKKEEEHPLINFPYDFHGNLRGLEKTLESDYFLHSEFDSPDFEPTQEDLDKPYGTGSYEEYMELHEEPRRLPSPELWQSRHVHINQQSHCT